MSLHLHPLNSMQKVLPILDLDLYGSNKLKRKKITSMVQMKRIPLKDPINVRNPLSQQLLLLPEEGPIRVYSVHRLLDLNLPWLIMMMDPIRMGQMVPSHLVSLVGR
jgi:hypothetical protein